MMNLNALMEAIAQNERCDARKQDSVKKLASDQELLAKIQSGKFSLKTMFKKQSKKQDMVHEVTMRIQQRQRDIENWETIKRFLTIYLSEQAIPLFKQRKTTKYVEAM